MTPTIGSEWQDDDVRIRRGERPARTLTVLEVDATHATVQWAETGKPSRISLARFGRPGRLVPARLAEIGASGIPARDLSFPALERLNALVAVNIDALKGWERVAELIQAAITEARADERRTCLAEVEQAFTLKGAAEYIRRGLPRRPAGPRGSR